MLRRPFLAAAGVLAFAPVARAERRGTGGPLRVGVDRSLADSGLAAALQRSFGADTGIAVRLVPGPALTVLDAVTQGEVDAALTNALEAEGRLAKQTLVHDRRLIAAGEFVLVGPTPQGKGRAGAASASAVEAVARMRDLAATVPALVFLSAGDGSGVHLAEQALWRAARIEPVPPWYVAADPARSFVGQVRERAAYALVERGAWAALGGAPLAVLVEGDPALVEPVHAMRSFRVSHPAGRIFMEWIAGGRGRAVVASQRGYRAPPR
jgi:tungstate transport system substrate-binding protein